MIALRHIAEAKGGLAKVAKAAGIERESLYKALSTHGNPRLSTIVGVMKAVGLKLTVGRPSPMFSVLAQNCKPLSNTIADWKWLQGLYWDTRPQRSASLAAGGR